MTGESLNVALLLAGLLLLLLSLLALNVSVRRLKEKSYKHDEGSPALKLAQLAHRNAAEHVPMLALLVVLLGLAAAPQTWVLVVGIGAVVARVGHAGAYLARSKSRMAASTLTYIVEIGGCVALFVQLARPLAPP